MTIVQGILGFVRKSSVEPYAAGFGPSNFAQMNARGELLVSQAMPSMAELTRMGAGFIKLTDAVATIAAAIPTTTAAHTLWNGEADGGKSIILDSLTWVNITSAGAATAFGMVCCLQKLPLTAVPATADTLTAVSTTNGKNLDPTKLKTSKTVTVTDDGWWPAPVSTFTTGAGTVTGGTTLHAQLNGSIIIPPRYLFCVSVLTVGVTATGNLAFKGYVAQIDNMMS